MIDIQLNTPFNLFYSVPFNELDITAKELLKTSGDEEICLNEYFIEIADAAIKFAASNCSVKADFSINPIVFNESIVACKNHKMDLGIKITTLFKGSEWAAFFIASAGKSFEIEAASLANNGMQLESYFIDLLGSLAVEKGMDLFQKKFAKYLSKFDLSTSNRYSPGYCDWKVDDQFTLFELIEDNNTNVSLNANALMSPIKSISGMIGIGKSVNFRKHECDLCNSTHCIYRNVK